MASSPDWKVYRGKEYVAATKYAEEAAVLVAAIGNEARVRFRHRHEVFGGPEDVALAADSYDGAAEEMHTRLHAALRLLAARSHNS